MQRMFEKRLTTDRGYGVFATGSIQKGQEVMRDQGKILSIAAYRRLPESHQDWAMQVNSRSVLIPHDIQAKDDTCFVNHSCDPNTLWSETKQCWIARRDIEKDEEITHDYALIWSEDIDEYVIETCRCGTIRCRGRITQSDWMLPSVQRTHRGHFPNFLEKKVRAQRTVPVRKREYA